MLITDIAECKRNRERVNIYADDSFLMACYKEIAVRHRLKNGAVLDEAAVAEIAREDGESYAFNVAVNYISVKPRTRKEVEDKLRARDVEGAAAGYALSKLDEYGYINDEEYAKMYAEELAQKYGERMIVQKLLGRGIGRDMAQRAASECDCAGALEETHARLCAKHAGEEEPKRKQKIIRALMARGFGYDEIRNVMDAGYED